MNKKTIFLQAFRDSIPVLTGYIFLGMGFGIMLQAKGFGWKWALLMSVTMYSGTMQYLSADLLSRAVSLLTCGITTFMVNARHLFYGISLIDRYRDAGKRKLYMIFGLTDETYSLVSRETLPNNRETIEYCFFVTLLDHSYWIIGGLLGVFAGSMIHINWEGIDFVLTALFVTVVVDQWLRATNHLDTLIGFGAAIAALIFFPGDSFLIPAMVLIFVLLTIFRPQLDHQPQKETETKEEA